MSYPINYPTPQGANVQIFSEGGTISDWVKPQGASFVWFTLIGAGGTGDPNTNLRGGGSGAVTNCLVPAFLIPDVLRVSVGAPANSSSVIYQAKDGTGYTLLTAASASGFNSLPASTSNFFSAAGFFQSVKGQDGVSGAISPSTTTFLSGGGSTNSTVNYGYVSFRDGIFQTQPIIVGSGGTGASDAIRAGVGCGGAFGVTSGGLGGPGLVVIISW